MSGHRDYVPSNDAEFDNWFKFIVEYVLERTSGSEPPWAYIPQSSVAGLEAAYADWFRHYEPTLVPHTDAATKEKNNARRRAEPVVREFVQRFLQWDPVTDGDRANMRLRNRDRVPTPHIEVTEAVELELGLRNIREIMVHFRVKGAAHKAKPTGYDGAVIVWAILNAPPASPDELVNHTMASRTPHAITFDESDRGKTVYICAAWQNERGNIGPWSEILNAIVP
jgi:hypothetical protein